MTIRDEALSNRVSTALASDNRLSDLPIDVRVCGSEVFLKGKVAFPEQLDVVQFVVAGIPGVRHVNVEELEVAKSSQ